MVTSPTATNNATTGIKGTRWAWRGGNVLKMLSDINPKTNHKTSNALRGSRHAPNINASPKIYNAAMIAAPASGAAMKCSVTIESMLKTMIERAIPRDSKCGASRQSQYSVAPSTSVGVICFT